MRHAGAEIAVTASFGVATYPETVKVKEQLFPAADKALYIAKHEGRNCVRAKPATRGHGQRVRVDVPQVASQGARSA